MSNELPESCQFAWVPVPGIVKIALEAGASLVPVYGFGHSELWTTVIDA